MVATLYLKPQNQLHESDLTFGKILILTFGLAIVVCSGRRSRLGDAFDLID